MTGFVSLTKWRRFFSATAPKPAREAGALPNQCDPRHPWLLQKQTHAVEVDDGMTDVQHLHPRMPPTIATPCCVTKFGNVVAPNLSGSSRLPFLAEFLESRIGAQWVPDRIEP
jgi:hypothetical protein